MLTYTLRTYVSKNPYYKYFRKWVVKTLIISILENGLEKSITGESKNGWLVKYYIRSWKITKWMVDGVPHGLENGLEKSITGEYEWMVDEVLHTFLENNKVDG